LCDIVLMSHKAFIAEPHINIGLVVGDGISVSWPLYMSLLRAKELIFTGDRITAEQAVDFGLANRVLEADDLLNEAHKLAEKLLKQPRQALRETKKIMNLYLHQNAAHILDTTLARQLAATLSEEHHSLARALIAKQKRNETPSG
jgi:enoyl-CoA hydratase